jgi:hypothetical protein
MGHKFVALRFLINRFNSSVEELSQYKKQIVYIQNILYNNSFPPHLINNFLEKQKKDINF